MAEITDKTRQALKILMRSFKTEPSLKERDIIESQACVAVNEEIDIHIRKLRESFNTQENVLLFNSCLNYGVNNKDALNRIVQNYHLNKMKKESFMNFVKRWTEQKDPTVFLLKQCSYIKVEALMEDLSKLLDDGE
jgi:predicted CopG family antitoxin